MFAVEIVVVGTGERLFRLDPKLHTYMRKQHNILLEVQDTVSCVILVLQYEEKSNKTVIGNPVTANEFCNIGEKT